MVYIQYTCIVMLKPSMQSYVLVVPINVYMQLSLQSEILRPFPQKGGTQVWASRVAFVRPLKSVYFFPQDSQCPGMHILWTSTSEQKSRLHLPKAHATNGNSYLSLA